MARSLHSESVSLKHDRASASCSAPSSFRATLRRSRHGGKNSCCSGAKRCRVLPPGPRVAPVTLPTASTGIFCILSHNNNNNMAPYVATLGAEKDDQGMLTRSYLRGHRRLNDEPAGNSKHKGAKKRFVHDRKKVKGHDWTHESHER